jgi:hypothetical protein
VLDGALQRLGIRAALGDELGDTAAADRDQRELGGNEEAVGEHEEQDGQNADDGGQSGVGGEHRVGLRLRCGATRPRG